MNPPLTLDNGHQYTSETIFEVFMSELAPFSFLAQSIRPGALYEHYKGQRYKVVHVARHSETLEELVVYQALYGAHEFWVRPLKMFLEEIEINGRLQPRFRAIVMH
jgi:hypothetical protein